MRKGADLSDCRCYRFALWRTWDESKSYAMFIGLNPSTADEVEDDNTIRRCVEFAKGWGYGGLCMANLFAYRATKPEVMMSAEDPVGKKNDQWLTELSEGAGVIVAAWGNHGSFLGRSEDVRGLLEKLHYLKLNATGEPSHPLYLPAHLEPKPFCF